MTAPRGEPALTPAQLPRYGASGRPSNVCDGGRPCPQPRAEASRLIIRADRVSRPTPPARLFFINPSMVYDMA